MTNDKIDRLRTYATIECCTGFVAGVQLQCSSGGSADGSIRHLEEAGISLYSGSSTCRRTNPDSRCKDRFHGEIACELDRRFAEKCQNHRRNDKRDRSTSFRGFPPQRWEAWSKRSNLRSKFVSSTVLTGCHPLRSFRFSRSLYPIRSGFQAMTGKM
jgi:hypothetical protein